MILTGELPVPVTDASTDVAHAPVCMSKAVMASLFPWRGRRALAMLRLQAVCSSAGLSRR